MVELAAVGRRRDREVAKEIADHVAPEYHLAKGSQLVAVVPSPPAVTAGTQNVAINAVAVHSSRPATPT